MTAVEPDAGAFDEPSDVPTIGVEEEFTLVDRAGGDPVWTAPALVARLADPRFKPELAAAQLEHMTEPFTALSGVAAALSAARRHLTTAAPELGFAASGTHPTGAEVHAFPDDHRYAETFDLHQWAARQQLVAALQVHVAVRPASVAVAVHDALRSYLPELIALGAASPLRGGADTGLACVRPLVAALLPRQGVPPAFGSYDGYLAMRRWMAAAGVHDERRLWWEVRLRPEFGTLEVRAVDSQPTSTQAGALVGFISALTVWLTDRARNGEPLPVHPSERIAENRWRACRWGREAHLADLDTGDLEPLPRRIGRLLEAVAPTADRLGGGHLLGGVEALLRRNGADDLRAAAAGPGGAAAASRWLAEVFAT